MQDFRDLKVWQKAHEVALDTYQLTASFPREERYGLTSQMRRCASSVPSNIAEGCGRSTDADFARFLQIAMGSASELEYQVLLARDLAFVTEEAHEAYAKKLVEVRRMLNGLLKKLRANS